MVEGYTNEANLSAQKPASQAQAWLPRPNEQPRGATRDQAAAQQVPSTPVEVVVPAVPCGLVTRARLWCTERGCGSGNASL